MDKYVLIAIALSIGFFGANTVYSRSSAIEENTVEFKRSTYSPGDTAVFLVKDSDLNSVHSCTAGWIDLTVDVGSPILQDTLWNLASGDPRPSAYSGLSDDCGYDIDSPESTPLAFVPIIRATLNQVSVPVDDIKPESGEFSISHHVNITGSDLLVEFSYETHDIYQPTDMRARVESTSDPAGEWLGFTEVSDADDSLLSPSSALFRGEVGLSSDPNAATQGDGVILVHIGDTITVEYLDENGVQVIASDESQIAEPTPTPEPIPSANLIALLFLAGAFAVLFLRRLGSLSNTY